MRPLILLSVCATFACSSNSNTGQSPNDAGVAQGGSAAVALGGDAGVAQGDAVVTFGGCALPVGSIYSAQSAPNIDNHGGPVSNGDNGCYVSCKVKQGTVYSVSATITSPDMALTLDSSDVTAGAQMSFWVGGATGTPNSVVSVDANRNAAPSCTLTVSGAGQLTIAPGVLFAEYSCPNIADPANLSQACQAQGFIYFTHCDT